MAPYKVVVLKDGYSRITEDHTAMKANCTCTLIKGKYNVLVDTMTAWDSSIIIEGLKAHGLKCEDIHYVVCSHGHSDHIGNNNLFLEAKHIIGFSVSYKDEYYFHPFETGEPYKIDEGLEVVPTPGHTLADVSVVVKTDDLGTVVIAGDLFEREEDLENPSLWRHIAGSDNPEKQEQNRNMVLHLADYIVPGHGPMFRVTQNMKEKKK